MNQPAPISPLLLVAALGLLGCQVPTSPKITDHGSSNKPFQHFSIASVDWIGENIDPSYWPEEIHPPASAFYDFWIHYNGEITASDITSAKVYYKDASGAWWDIVYSPELIDTVGKVIGGFGRWYQASPHDLNLGPYMAEIRLSNGVVAQYFFNTVRPGADTTTTVYTEDFSSGPPPNSGPMLKRAVVSASDSYKVSTSSLKVVFSVADSHVHNGILVFQDEAKGYVGETSLFHSPVTGLPTALVGSTIAVSGEANTVNANDSDITFAAGRSFDDISRVLVVLVDGAQYPLTSDGTITYDYSSTSASTPLVPVSHAGDDKNAAAGDTITLVGSVERAANPVYHWTLTKPDGSAAVLSNEGALSPTFKIDKSGAYRATFEVSSNGMTSVADEVVVYAYQRRVEGLPADIHAIEYDKVHDRFVILHGAPTKITLLDPVSGTTQFASLPVNTSGSSLAISPDGTKAAVGGGDKLSIFSIEGSTPQILNSWTVSGFGPSNNTWMTPSWLAWNDSGYVVSIAPAIQSQKPIDLRIIEASTGEQSFAIVSALRQSDFARISPSGKSIYVLPNTAPPSELYWIGVGAVPVPTDNFVATQYNGAHSIGGRDLWFDEAGQVILGSGSVFSVTESGSSTTDMIYKGSLGPVAGGGLINSLSHSSEATLLGHKSLYALIVGKYLGPYKTSDTEIVFADKSFDDVTTFSLPFFETNLGRKQWRGTFVNWKSDGSELYVVARSEDPLPTKWNLFVY